MPEPQCLPGDSNSRHGYLKNIFDGKKGLGPIPSSAINLNKKREDAAKKSKSGDSSTLKTEGLIPSQPAQAIFHFQVLKRIQEG
jgi:hypothetical protein